MPKVAAILLVAIVLAGCRQEVSHAAVPPPVTVAQPLKRTVTDWDDFTGRFEAVEDVQVKARVGGFVTNVAFKDGDIVHAGDLLYIIDPRPFEAIAERVAWWAEIFEPPCVGYAATLAEVEMLARAGADFVAVGECIFNDARGPAAALAGHR